MSYDAAKNYKILKGMVTLMANTGAGRTSLSR